MSGWSCKLLVCIAQCISSITTLEFKEITVEAVGPLGSNGLLEDDQMDELIDIYTSFDEATFTNSEQRQWELRAAEKVKEILMRYVDL